MYSLSVSLSLSLSLTASYPYVLEICLPIPSPSVILKVSTWSPTLGLYITDKMTVGEAWAVTCGL